MQLSLLLLCATASAAAGAPEVRFVPEAPRLGDLAVVHVRGLGAGAGELHAFGHASALDPVGEGRHRGFVPVPVDTVPGTAVVAVVVDGEVVARARLPVRGRAFEQSELRVRKRFTRKKPPKVRRRIRRESARMRKLWARPTTAARVLGAAHRPTAGPRTSPFGVQRVFNGETRSVHYGLDLDGRTGAPVRAAFPGRVALSGHRYYSGRTLVLDHGSGLFTMYFHLSKRRVRLGQVVAAGDRLGDVGKSGRVTGPHLHFAVAVRVRALEGKRKGKTRSMYVDPEPVLARGF